MRDHLMCERTGRRDGPQHITAALDALREDPRRWGATPARQIRVRRGAFQQRRPATFTDD